MPNAIAYIKDHVADENVTISSIADFVGMDKDYFGKKFKTYTGYSPYDYLLNKRIKKAKYLLTTTKMSIAEIAQETGFGSQSNFAVAFKKKAGCTPKDFRKLDMTYSAEDQDSIT